MAERTGATALGLTHPPKGNTDAVTAAIGSTAWTALARITWVLGADPGDETGARRVVAVAKTNYRESELGLSSVIGHHQATEAGFVTDIQSSDVAAEAITSPPPAPEDGDDSEDACAALTTILNDGTEHWVRPVKDAMIEAGFTAKQIRGAKEKLRVRSVHVGRAAVPGRT